MEKTKNYSAKNLGKITKKIKNQIIIFFSVFGLFFSLNSFGNSIEISSSIDQIYSGWLDNFSTTHFKYGNNNYEGLVFWKDFLQLNTGVVIQTQDGWFKVTCHKQLRGYYFNPTRGSMLWPLDTGALADLQSVDSSYTGMSIDGGRFFDCDGLNENNIYGQIKHNLFGFNDYYLIAGTQMDFDNNAYLPYLTGSFRYADFVGHIWDSYGGIAQVNTPTSLDPYEVVNDFNINDIENAEINVYYKSEPITVFGLSTGKKIIAMTTNGVLLINNQEVGSMGGVGNGDSLQIWLKSAPNYNTTISANLIIGIKYDTFSIKTMSDEHVDLSTAEKFQILNMLKRLKNRYENDPPRQKLFLKEYKEKIKELLDEMNEEINGGNTLYQHLNIKRALILEFMLEKLEEMLDELRQIGDIYKAPNGKKYTITFDPENIKCQYTAPEFMIKKCFYTYEKIISYINSNNPVSNGFIDKDVIIAPNGKTYYVVETAPGLRTCSNFLRKRYFTSLNSMQNYIKINNPVVKQRNHISDTAFESFYHRAPNGKEYEISKTTSGQYYSQNFISPKYFNSIQDIKKFIDINNPRR